MADSKQRNDNKNHRVVSARSAAAAVLNRFEPQKSNADTLIEAFIEKTTQRQRTTDLVYGTIRNRTALDLVITTFTNRRVKRIPTNPPAADNIIRIGAYELIYCPQTPVYSIVNEAVETVKKFAGHKQAAFVNAILRKIASHITNRQSPLSKEIAKRTLPQNTSTGCLFDADFLPDLLNQPADYLSDAFSLPNWLIRNWLEQFSTEQTKQICFASNRRPSIYLRPNVLRTTANDLAEKLTQAGVNIRLIDDSIIQARAPKQITKLPGFADGLFTVQDPSATIPAKLLGPQTGWKILDLCAAPGTKTTQLAELTNDHAEIFATDIDDGRLAFIEQNIQRLKLKSITVFKYSDLQKIIDNAGLFDCVLLDVPCSNTACLAKRPEVRLRITKKAIQTLAQKQLALLNKASALIKPQGKICYSTCSIQLEENNLLIRDFLKDNSNFTLESEKLTLPFADFPDHDGSYAAILMKK
jgi:16S rRNA (cytosine967-C5)-methyltransferase